MGERTAGRPSQSGPVTSQSLTLQTPDPQDPWTEGGPRGRPILHWLATADQKTFNHFSDNGTPNLTFLLSFRQFFSLFLGGGVVNLLTSAA